MVAMVYTNPKQSLFSSNLNKTASSLQILEYGNSASYFNQSKKQVARLKKANSPELIQIFMQIQLLSYKKEKIQLIHLYMVGLITCGALYTNI